MIATAPSDPLPARVPAPSGRPAGGEPSAGPPGALLLGADYRALGAVRSLGRRGVAVWVLVEPDEPLAAFSRYARRAVRWPSGDAAGRVAFLRGLARTAGIDGWALIPSSDAAAALLARHHAELSEHFTVAVPAWDVLRWAYDKRLTHELADRVGVAAPVSIRVTGDLHEATAHLTFPAVVKPAVKEAANALTTAKAWRVDDRAELEARYVSACALIGAEQVLIQELVPGRDGQLSWAALCRDGEPLAWLTARRTRQYPADFGRASTFVETADCPEVVGPSRRLVQALGYTGLIEIEYKRDARDGLVKLLDMNPRLWGWHSLGARAGVDFPWLQWRTLRGETIEPTHAAHGVGWLRVCTDTPTALRELARRRLSWREYARTLRRPREAAILAADDPLPGLLELPVLAYVLARRLRTGQAV